MIAEDKRAFTDVEIAEKRMMVIVESIRPEKKELFSNVSLSAEIATRSFEEMSENLKFS